MQLPALTAQTRAGVTVHLDVAQAHGWSLRLPDDPQAGVVGRLRLRFRPSRGSIDFELEPEARGQGYAAAALRTVSRWALDPEGADLQALLWEAAVGNWPARRAVWACGFQVEGQVRGLLADSTGPGPPNVRPGWIGTLLRGEALQPLLPWLEPPVIEMGELLLRPTTPGDLDRIVEACRDPRTQQFLPLVPRGYGLEDAAAYLLWTEEEQAGGNGLSWAVAQVDEPDELLGQISVSGLAAGTSVSGEIGYWMHPDARRLGFARGALRAVCRHSLLPVADGGLGLLRVLVRVAGSNLVSQRVALSAGLRPAGVDRRAEVLGDGAIDDHLRYDLVADELDEAWAHPSALR